MCTGHIGPQALYECACMCVCVVTGVPMVLASQPVPVHLGAHAHVCMFHVWMWAWSGNVCTCTPRGPGTAHTQVFRYYPELDLGVRAHWGTHMASVWGMDTLLPFLHLAGDYKRNQERCFQGTMFFQVSGIPVTILLFSTLVTWDKLAGEISLPSFSWSRLCPNWGHLAKEESGPEMPYVS